MEKKLLKNIVNQNRDKWKNLNWICLKIRKKTVFSLKKYAYEINKTEIINKESNEQNFHSERILHTL